MAAILSCFLAGCTPGPTDPTRPQVSVLDNAFSPRSVTVTVGGIVNWSWGGTAEHNVVFGASSGIPSSDLQRSGSFQAQFNTPGTFDYFCSLHTGMVGTVTVR
jgi:plastocyanin